MWNGQPEGGEAGSATSPRMAYSEYDERVRDRMSQEYARWHRGYVRLFGALMREGIMAPNVDAETLGIGFATLADGLVDQQSLDPSLEPEGVMRAFLSPFLVDGAAAGHLR